MAAAEGVSGRDGAAAWAAASGWSGAGGAADMAAGAFAASMAASGAGFGAGHAPAGAAADVCRLGPAGGAEPGAADDDGATGASGAAPDGDDRRGPVRSAARDPLQVLLPDGAAVLQNVWSICHRGPPPLALPHEAPSALEILDFGGGEARSGGGGGGGAASLVLPGAAAYGSLPVKAAESTERPHGAAGSLGRWCLKATVVIGWPQGVCSHAALCVESAALWVE